MRVRLLVVAILVLAVRAPSPVARADAPTRKVWVYFRDKGPDPRLEAEVADALRHFEAAPPHPSRNG